MNKRIKNAADEALKIHRKGTAMQIAIGIACQRTGVEKRLIARELNKRSQASKRRRKNKEKESQPSLPLQGLPEIELSDVFLSYFGVSIEEMREDAKRHEEFHKSGFVLTDNLEAYE